MLNNKKVIKARAFLKDTNRMVDVECLNLPQETFVGRDWQYGKTCQTTFHEAEIMWFLNLVDEKGNEIFEGDIVVFEDACSDNAEDTFFNRGVVEFVQGSINITNRVSVCVEDLLDGDTLEVEVIGNIYENPDLLERNYG